MPVLVVALLDETDHGDLLAAIVFALASVTDAIDGYLARSRNAITTFGKLMDPVADKLLIIAALVALVSLDRLPGVGRDGDHRARVRGDRHALAATQQGVVIAANWWGKAKTIVQVAAIFFVIAFDPTPLWVDVLVYAAVGDHRHLRHRLLLRAAAPAARGRGARAADRSSPREAGRRAARVLAAAGALAAGGRVAIIAQPRHRRPTRSRPASRTRERTAILGQEGLHVRARRHPSAARCARPRDYRLGDDRAVLLERRRLPRARRRHRRAARRSTGRDLPFRGLHRHRRRFATVADRARPAARRARPPAPRARRRAGPALSARPRRATRASTCDARGARRVASSRRSSPSRPKRSATTLCWWIVSRFSWRAETNVPSRRSPKRSTTPRDHLAHAVLDEARAAVGLLDDGALVGALHQLVDLATTSSPRRSRAASPPRSRSSQSSGQPMCSVPRPRWLCVATGTCSKIRVDLVVGEAVVAEALARAGRRRAAARTGRRSCPARRRRPAGACRARRPPPSRTACRSPASGCPDTGAGLCSG